MPDKPSQEQEKRIKYTDRVANAVILRNTVDWTEAGRDWVASGDEVKREDRALRSPDWTGHIT